MAAAVKVEASPGRPSAHQGAAATAPARESAGGSREVTLEGSMEGGGCPPPGFVGGWRWQAAGGPGRANLRK
ncbi:hypothetical protein TSOC_008277 [Tetrabaena socialis]|uniref:Uncharacterized protein n=1 Tax=Tetrabaena socialis TaxID=47790 RepID=A0A2J7ZYV9_9CHLO|nr:hypothetical protein TSOC_008277 [Tetrabaena socialis]|eukprot:PNH05453.1 hypothetical protein TSOC_008277 [Tetrabaena socialis]